MNVKFKSKGYFRNYLNINGYTLRNNIWDKDGEMVINDMMLEYGGKNGEGHMSGECFQCDLWAFPEWMFDVISDE